MQAIKLAHQLRTATGLPLSPILIFEHPSAREVACHILSELFNSSYNDHEGRERTSQLASAFFGLLGIVKVDHVAVTTSNFDATLADWIALPGSVLCKGPLRNETQRIIEAFVQTVGGATF